MKIVGAWFGFLIQTRFAAVCLLASFVGGCAVTPDADTSYALVPAPTVPDVDSVWISTTRYVQTGASRKPEVLRVVRLRDGRPVVAGETFGYRGEIIEGAYGTVVYTEACAAKVPQNLKAPPEAPNQCGWHLCYPPDIGKTFVRKMFIYADLYSCQPKTGVYQFSAVGTGSTAYGDVVIGDAQVDFGMFSKVTWRSYVKPGYGEVHGDSPGRVTTYSTVDVRLIPNGSDQSSLLPRNSRRMRLGEFLNVEPTQASGSPRKCRIVAYGDSLTEGLGVSKEESYPAVLSRMIGVEVCNLGASGRTTLVALEALPEVHAVQPKIVIIILGANDALRGVTPQITKENIKTIVKDLTARGVLVVLGGVGLRHENSPGYFEALQSLYAEIARELSRDVLFVPEAMEGVLGVPEMTSSDGMHPNAEGYRKLAQNLHSGAFTGALDILKSAQKIPTE